MAQDAADAADALGAANRISCADRVRSRGDFLTTVQRFQETATHWGNHHDACHVVSSSPRWCTVRLSKSRFDAPRTSAVSSRSLAYFRTIAPVSCPIAPIVVCADVSPNMKSLSVNVVNTSVG